MEGGRGANHVGSATDIGMVGQRRWGGGRGIGVGELRKRENTCPKATLALRILHNTEILFSVDVIAACANRSRPERPMFWRRGSEFGAPQRGFTGRPVKPASADHKLFTATIAFSPEEHMIVVHVTTQWW